MAKNLPLKNTQKIQLVRWLIENSDKLNGQTIPEIANKARKELKLYCADSTIKRTIDDGGFPIKYTRNSNAFPPLAQLFHRMVRLEQAYTELCKQVGVTPVDMSDLSTSDKD